MGTDLAGIDALPRSQKPGMSSIANFGAWAQAAPVNLVNASEAAGESLIRLAYALSTAHAYR